MNNIDAETIIQNLRKVYNYFTNIQHTTYATYINNAINAINTNHWINVNTQLPVQHDSIFSRLKNTPYWSDTMYEKKSDDVRVVCELKDFGTQIVTHSYTIDGKWRIEDDEENPSRKVLYWMENPSLPQ